MEVKEKPSITKKELVESLLVVSEATKVLAQEVMLIPNEDEDNGGKENATK